MLCTVIWFVDKFQTSAAFKLFPLNQMRQIRQLANPGATGKLFTSRKHFSVH